MHAIYKTLILFGAMGLANPAYSVYSADKPIENQAPGPASGARPCVSAGPAEAPTYVVLGKSTVIPLRVKVARILVSGQVSGGAGKPQTANANASQPAASVPPPPESVADVEVMLLSPSDLFFRGKKAGSMNVILQNAEGVCFVKDIVVTIDPSTLQAKLDELMPEEAGIKIKGAENALVLTGAVSDAIKLDQVMNLATSYGDGKKVVNLLRVMTPQQVMLEVKIAEVGKTLLDTLGSRVGINRSSGGGVNTYSLLSSFLSNGGGVLEALKIGRTALNIDGQKNDGLVRVLAEPNIMAISGQQASFLSGGKIFIPVAQTNNFGTTTITLEEKEFGIGVKFTPTVLDGTRVNLKLISEVSDLSQTGSPFTTVGGVTSVLPSLTV